MQVSLVIPVRDEEATIRVLLDSLLDQTRRPDEVVITDGGSTDRTVEIIEAYARTIPRVRLIRTAGAFPGEGRNLGVQAAAHDVIAFTDAGVRADSRWLEKLCEPLERDPAVDVVYGHLEPITDSYFTECAAVAYVPAPRERAGQRIRAPFLPCSLMKRSVWHAAGGFPPYRAAEDLIFMEAIERKGFRIAYAPAAAVYWELAPDWRSTFRRFATYSHHNLTAGRARYWHYGVVRMYAIALGFGLLGVIHTPWWWLVPAGGLIARFGRIAVAKRDAFAFGGVLQPRRLLTLAGLLLLLDAATFWGAMTWALTRIRPAPERKPAGRR